MVCAISVLWRRARRLAKPRRRCNGQRSRPNSRTMPRFFPASRPHWRVCNMFWRQQLAGAIFQNRSLRRRRQWLTCGVGSTLARMVAVLFGPERTGLQNPDLVVANGIIEVPVNPEFRSLNLAQCVLLICYEWLCASEAAATRQQTQRCAGRCNGKIPACRFAGGRSWAGQLFLAPGESGWHAIESCAICSCDWISPDRKSGLCMASGGRCGGMCPKTQQRRTDPTTMRSEAANGSSKTDI